MNKKIKTQKKDTSDSRLLFVLSGAVILAIVFIAAILFTTPWDSPAPDETDQIRIGAIYNLNGTQAALDIPSAQGAKLAVQEINEQGGIGGKKIQLILYDGESNTTKIREAATRLIHEDHVVAVIGMSDSDMVLPAAQTAAASNTVFISSGATSPGLPDEVPGYLFLSCFGDNAQAAVAAEYAKNDLHASTAYIISDDSMQFTRLLSQYFAERFTQAGGIVVGNMTYAGTSSTGSLPIHVLQEIPSPPAVLYIACGPQDCGKLIREIRDAGITAPIMGGDSFDTPDLVTDAGTGADRIFFTTHGYINRTSTDLAIREFFNRYERAFGQEPTAFSGLGYDTINVLARAINTSSSTGDIRDGLYSPDPYDGLTGAISYQNHVRIPVKSVMLMKIDNGTFLPVGERIPAQVPEA